MKLNYKQTLKIICVLSSLLLIGCQSLNCRFGCDSTDYTDARELAPLKLPENSLMLSKRYDIPAIPNNNNPLIDDISPPDYLKE